MGKYTVVGLKYAIYDHGMKLEQWYMYFNDCSSPEHAVTKALLKTGDTLWVAAVLEGHVKGWLESGPMHGE
jgi:hypothetical protein